MMKTELIISDRNCTVFGDEAPEYILIQPTGRHESGYTEQEYEYIKRNTGKMIALVSFEIKEWNIELSPWHARQAFGDEEFGDGAKETLGFITDMLVSEIHSMFGSNIKLIIGGYSLAGLFSLWSVYQTDIFSAAAACSPSVWIDGWNDYIIDRRPYTDNIYLSIGTKEHRTRNPLIQGVRDSVILQNEILQQQGKNTELEFNPGNHFQDNMERTAKGFLWCLNY